MHGSGRAGRFGPHPPASHLRALGREQMLEPSSEFESWLCQSVAACLMFVPRLLVIILAQAGNSLRRVLKSQKASGI